VVALLSAWYSPWHAFRTVSLNMYVLTSTGGPRTGRSRRRTHLGCLCSIGWHAKDAYASAKAQLKAGRGSRPYDLSKADGRADVGRATHIVEQVNDMCQTHLCRARRVAAQDSNGQRYVKAELARMDKAADELLVQRDVGRGQQGRIMRFLKEVLSVGGRRPRERRQQVGEARLEGRDITAHGERERAGLADY
jgi:hypothetical protein